MKKQIFSEISPVRRQLATIALATLLPLVIWGGLQLYRNVEAGRSELVAQSSDRAAEIMRFVDAQLIAEIKLGDVLASAVSQNTSSVPAAYDLAQKFMLASGTWKSVQLVEPRTGLQLFDGRRPLGIASSPASPDAIAFLRSGASKSTVDSIFRRGDGSAYLSLKVPVRRRGKLIYLLVVEINPDSIHRLVFPKYPPAGVVSAVVDKNGRFVSRSLDQPRWVGRPGSTYLQAASKQGGHGLYKNITLEGVPTYAAYVASVTSGFSTHVALASAPFDKSSLWSYLVGIIIVGISMCISAVLIWLAFQDIARSRAEQQLMLQAQKMEAVGHLTGGIAHDFNNLLTAIIGGIDLFLRRSDPADKNHRYLTLAQEAAQRGIKLTSRLLSFSRIQTLAIETVDIKATLDGISQLVDQLVGPNIARQIIVADDARWVTTDFNQLELALLNLAGNGKDAMPDGGTLTFEAKRVSSRRNGKPWTCVRLSVTDTGHGMDPSTLSQAFDPFFTTKEVSKGTGLGLAQVYTLARQSGGEAKIDSEPGKGTTVSIMLPIAASEIIMSGYSQHLDQSCPAGTPSNIRIVVIDDDHAVRQIIVENLRSIGYIVFEYSNGADALDALSSIDPHLVVVDFLMPGLNGAEVALRVRKMRPSQKLLIISGYMDSLGLNAAVADLPILRKPFGADILAEHVSALVNADSTEIQANAAKSA